MDLKEFAIIETFRGLEPDRQRYILEKLLHETKQTSITMKFKNKEQEELYKFASRQWPLMSQEFFNQICERWEFLCRESYGDHLTGTVEIGDLYLKSKSFEDDYYEETPFSPYVRNYFFYAEVFNECDWKYMYITTLFPGKEWCENYLIKDLMELPQEDYIEKMKEYGYL